MESILFWTYVINASLLIVHEMDSAYWKEWVLFPFLDSGKGDSDNLKNFLIIHIPLIVFMILGALWVDVLLTRGLVVSLITAGAGIFAFFFHTYHLRKGREEFNTPFSKALLYTIFPVSLLQAGLSIYFFFQ